ncbi:MAG: sigma-70 family RNA polymerase sigma factor [bacterium]|nr:sigma-70 family RNA polymerase sigma factor [bacterium]
MPPPEPERPEALLSEIGWLDTLAHALVREPELAEDAAQEAVLAALQRGPVRGTNLRGWLATVVRNAVRKTRRSERRRRDREELWSSGQSRVLSAEDAERSFALRHDLASAVRDLDGPLRQVVLLRFVHDLALREVAARVGAPLSTVDSRIRRALVILRERLDRDGDFDARACALLALRRGPSPRGLARAAALLGIVSAAAVAVIASRLPAVTSVPVERPTFDGPAQVSRSSSAPSPAAARRAIAPARPEPIAATGGAIAVDVRDRSGAPVAGVFVRAWPRDNARSRSLSPGERTGAAGRLELAGLVAGGYRLVFDRLAGIDVEVRDGAVTRIARTLAGPAAAGVVVDEQGAPVPDAELWVSAAPAGWLEGDAWVVGEVEDAAVARTDALGRFEIPTIGDAVLLGARAAGRSPSAPLRLGSLGGRLDALRLTLPGPGGAVAGRVRSPGGDPLEGAVVYVDTRQGQRVPEPLLATTTDAEGRFRFAGVRPGVHELSVHAAGLLPWRAGIEVFAHGEALAQVELRGGAFIAGNVRDPSGRAVAGAEVFAGERPWQWAPAFRHAKSTRSGADGSFVLHGLERKALWLTVAAGQGARRTERITPPADVELVLAPLPELSGRVVDSRGRGIGGCLVRAGASHASWRWAETDAAGTFAVAVESDGTQRLTVREKGAIVHEGEASPDKEVVIAIPDGERPSATVSGRILAGGTEPSHLVVEEVTQRRPYRVGLRVESPRFHSAPIVPGVYRMRVVHDAFEFELPGVWRLAPGAAVDVGTVAFEPAATTEIDLAHEGPLRDVRYWIRDEGGSIVEERRFSDPTPYLPLRVQLRPGTYSLVVTSATTVPLRGVLRVDGGAPSQHSFRLVSGIPRELLLRPRAGGRIFDRVHVVLEGEHGTLMDVHITPSFQRTDGAYRFALGLAPGTYQLRASLGELGGEATLVVRAGDAETVEVVLE